MSLFNIAHSIIFNIAHSIIFNIAHSIIFFPQTKIQRSPIWNPSKFYCCVFTVATDYLNLLSERRKILKQVVKFVHVNIELIWFKKYQILENIWSSWMFPPSGVLDIFVLNKFPIG